MGKHDEWLIMGKHHECGAPVMEVSLKPYPREQHPTFCFLSRQHNGPHQDREGNMKIYAFGQYRTEIIDE